MNCTVAIFALWTGALTGVACTAALRANPEHAAAPSPASSPAAGSGFLNISFENITGVWIYHSDCVLQNGVWHAKEGQHFTPWTLSLGADGRFESAFRVPGSDGSRYMVSRGTYVRGAGTIQFQCETEPPAWQGIGRAELFKEGLQEYLRLSGGGYGYIWARR